MDIDEANIVTRGSWIKHVLFVCPLQRPQGRGNSVFDLYGQRAPLVRHVVGENIPNASRPRV